MGRMPLAVFLWPGLPQLWRKGSWAALAYAVAFAAMVSVLLVLSLLWSELLPGVVRNAAWAAAGGVWLGSAVLSWYRDRWATARSEGRARRVPDPFPEALDHYLKGNWFEAECVLEGQLGRNPGDVEARVLLAGLLRQMGRFDEAASQLQRVERLEGSEKWELEIQREKRRVEEARHAQAAKPPAIP